MMDLSGTKHDREQHPVVYVQGHGQAGDKHIASDAHEKVWVDNVTNMLNKMQLLQAAEVLANEKRHQRWDVCHIRKGRETRIIL